MLRPWLGYDSGKGPASKPPRLERATPRRSQSRFAARRDAAGRALPPRHSCTTSATRARDVKGERSASVESAIGVESAISANAHEPLCSGDTKIARH